MAAHHEAAAQASYWLTQGAIEASLQAKETTNATATAAVAAAAVHRNGSRGRLEGRKRKLPVRTGSGSSGSGKWLAHMTSKAVTSLEQRKKRQCKVTDDNALFLH